MWVRWAAAFLAAALAIAFATAIYRHYHPRPPTLTLQATRFAELDGWSDDNVAAALPAFLKSCAVVTARADGTAFFPLFYTAKGNTRTHGMRRCAAACTLAYPD